MPERISTRWLVSAQLTRQISIAGVVEEAGGEVVLVEAVVAERALHLEVVDGEADGVLDLARGEAGGGREGGAVEGEVAVVVGEAEHGAVAARDAPAPGERGGAGVEVGLEGGGEGFSWCLIVRSPLVGRDSGGGIAERLTGVAPPTT